jgi:hypothetical protein
LKKLGRFAAVTAPAVVLILAAKSKPAAAVTQSPPSSRRLKTPGEAIEVAAVLTSVASLPVEAWHYKAETGLDTRAHIGPYAEDFKAAFGVGDGATISTVDAIGVCLAAIKALASKVEILEGQLQSAGRSGAA